MSTTVFLIREKNSNTFLCSSTQRTFESSIEIASQFSSKANAEKAIRRMFHDGVNPYGGHTYTIDGIQYHHSHLQEYIQLLKDTSSTTGHLSAIIAYVEETGVERKCDAEVVEATVTVAIVGE